MYPSEANPATQKVLIFAGVGILVFLFILFIVITQVAKPKAEAKISPSPTPEIGSTNLFGNTEKPIVKQGGQSATLSAAPTFPPKAAQPVPGALAKIGEETIYNTDLNEELASYPTSDDPGTRERIFRKMVDDSITLQGANKLKIASLDASIYNSKDKDYNKRIKAVAAAKQAIEDNADGFSGTIVQIWFYNQKPGRIGYAQGRQIAGQKINDLHAQVKSGKMTMEQAGDAIRADSSLYDVDEAFRINASFDFIATKAKPATFDEGFNKIMSGMKVGQISDVYTAKDEDTNGNMIDALYMFARIDSINTKGGYSSYEDWLVKQKKTYAVVTY